MDRRWKDPQLRPLEKELVSGYHTEHLASPEALSPADGAIDNTALLARVVCQIEPGKVVRGRNIVRIALRRGARLSQSGRGRVEKNRAGRALPAIARLKSEKGAHST